MAKAERFEPVEVDINDTGLAEGVEQEQNLKEDWQARACPPPMGRYRLRLFIDDDTILEQNTKQGFSKDDPNGKYYKKQIACKIQDPSGKWQDSITYYGVSTGVPKGKKASSMAGILQMCRVKVPDRLSDLALGKLFLRAMIKLDGPEQIADCDWSGWDSNNTKRGDFGAVALIDATKKLANTMINFPKKADGMYEHIVKTKEGLEVVAKLKVVRWIPQPKVVQQATNGAVKATPVVIIPVAEPKETPALDMGDDGEVVLEL